MRFGSSLSIIVLSILVYILDLNVPIVNLFQVARQLTSSREGGALVGSAYQDSYSHLFLFFRKIFSGKVSQVRVMDVCCSSRAIIVVLQPKPERSYIPLSRHQFLKGSAEWYRVGRARGMLWKTAWFVKRGCRRHYSYGGHII